MFLLTYLRPTFIIIYMTNKLSQDLQLAPSQLYVADLQKMKKFYADYAGLDTLESSASRVILGQNKVPILELIEKSKLSFASPDTAGLFHNAILYDSRKELSKSVVGLATNAPQSFSGTGDHLVSEAFYFTDPEGNGLELYFDRPRDQWTWENGQVKMDTLYIDPNQYIESNINSTEKNLAKKLGHVHLRVGDIDQAKMFYISLLGFDVTADLPGALFMSVAGYHHHIAVNTWMSKNAAKRQAALGLSEIGITLSSDDDVSNLATRLESSGWPFKYHNGQIYVSDPWDNHLVFRS